jgi:hypothetical protein
MIARKGGSKKRAKGVQDHEKMDECMNISMQNTKTMSATQENEIGTRNKIDSRKKNGRG